MEFLKNFLGSSNFSVYNYCILRKLMPSVCAGVSLVTPSMATLCCDYSFVLFRLTSKGGAVSSSSPSPQSCSLGGGTEF